MFIDTFRIQKCLETVKRQNPLKYSKNLVKSPVSGHFPYSKDFVVSQVYSYIPYSKELVVSMFLDTFRTQRNWPFPCFLTLLYSKFIHNRSCVSVCLSQKSLYLYSKDLVVSQVYRHFPYSRELVVSMFLDTFRIQRIWSLFLFIDTFGIQGIWSFLLYPDTFHIQKCLETVKQNPWK